MVGCKASRAHVWRRLRAIVVSLGVSATGKMVLVLTPSAMDGLLTELRKAAVSGVDDEGSAGLASMGSWDARQLLLADQRSRATSWWRADEPEVSVTKVMDDRGARLATWLASMGRDGFARERAVIRLAVEPGLDADRLLALRADDPVELVRVRAWKALESRFSGAGLPLGGADLPALLGVRINDSACAQPGVAPLRRRGHATARRQRSTPESASREP